MSTFNQDDLLQLAADFGATLKRLGIYCATAESCTGGLLAASFTSCAGSSEWFERGFVTYSNAAKAENLGVSLETLDSFGAVSEPTAMEMASGLLLSNSTVDLGLSTTGIAGPGGAVPGKPVGMVCFGVAKRTVEGISSRAFTKVLEGDRNQVRNQAVAIMMQAALNEL